MGALLDLWKSERGLVAITLIASATVALALGVISTDQWIDYTKWLFAAYAAGKTATSVAGIVSGHKTAESSAKTATSVAPTLLIMLALGGVAVSTPACSSGQRQDVLRGSLTSLNVARDGFVAWDAKHQRDIVERSTSRVEAERSVAAYYATRQNVIDGMEAAYRAIAVAALASDEVTLSGAIRQASEILRLIARITGDPNADEMHSRGTSP